MSSLFLGGFLVSRFYSITDAAMLYCGVRATEKVGTRMSSRIVRAITLGELGKVQRMSRGWLLDESNMEKLWLYMKRRWKIEPLPEESFSEAG
jgi:hypothetical protein